MAAVIADPAPAGGAVPFKRGKKKLLIIGAAVLAVAMAGGGGAVWILKKRAHAAMEALGDDGAGSTADEAHGAAKPDARTPPTYLPLDPFVINLADKEADRYAQIGITLEVESPVFADQMKGYMPAVRNAILMIIAHKTSRELLGRAGKEELAQEIMRESVRPMGIEIAPPETVTPAVVAVAASGTEKLVQDEAAPAEIRKVVKKHAEAVRNPVQHVHFSSFIIQ
ncbi:MAG: flagellar basal body-associated FliL family protein [Caldimonas sp.]